MSDVEVLAPGTAIVRMPEATELERAQDPSRNAIEVLSQARRLLDEASQDEDVDRLIDLKEGAELIRVWSVQKEMGKDLELSAAEFVRRTERAIGKAIRAGQERGVIRTQQQTRAGHRDEISTSPADLIPACQERSDYYAFADQATDEEFEEVLAEAKAEGNLSRANVKRKVTKAPPKPGKRPEHLRNTRHIDPNRVVNATVMAAAVDDTTFELLEGRYGELDPALIDGWVCSLNEAIKALSRLRSNLKKEQTQ